MSSGTKKVEAPEISSGGVVGKVRKSESRKSKRIGKRKEDLYSGEFKTTNAKTDTILVVIDSSVVVFFQRPLNSDSSSK